MRVSGPLSLVPYPYLSICMTTFETRNPKFETHDHVVIVTGAGGRLGRCIARAYHEAGARVAGFYRRLPQEASSAVDLTVQADVSDERSVRESFEKVIETCGRVDTLVHTVGSWDGRPILETSLDQWNAQLELNLTTTFLCFREALAHMKTRGGALIGIASGQGADRGVAQQAGYSASKGGLVRLVEAIADEYAGTGVTAYALAPSTILYDEQASGGVRAEDLASTCLFLSSPAGRSMNGATIRVYGG